MFAGTYAVSKDDPRRDEALLLASGSHRFELVRRLLDAGADPNAQDAQARSPVYVAALSGDLAITRLLTESGADVTNGPGGPTALVAAAMAGHTEMARFLLTRDPDPHRVFGEAEAGLSAVVIALLYRSDETFDLLARDLRRRPEWIERGGGALAIAGSIDDVRALHVLLALDDTHALRTGAGPGALALAAGKGSERSVRALLTAGVSTTADAGDMDALGAAAMAGHRVLAELLLAHGAEVNRRHFHGMTPLLLAAHGGSTEVVDVLLAAGADTSVRDDDGRNAADLALGQGHVDLATRLRALVPQTE